MRIWIAILSLLCLVAFASPGMTQNRSFVIEAADFNYTIGTSSHFYQQQNVFMPGILPFDDQAGYWDFSTFTSAQTATVQVIDTASAPYNSYYPGATACSMTQLLGQPMSYMYEVVTPTGFYWDGWYQTQLGYHIVGDYTPNIEAYHFPMLMGVAWSSTSYYFQDWVGTGITVNVSESHQSTVVAEGWVMTNEIPYWMQCLVIRTYHTYADGLGGSDNYWLYEWVVPNGFSGGNGVAACMSHMGQNSDFDYCRYALVLGSTNVKPELPLMVDTNDLPEGGGVVNFTLDGGGGEANRNYIILGSVSGTSPGLPMPGGMVTMPLVWDAFSDLSISMGNSPAMLNFRKTLDSAGQATAQLNSGGPLPPGLVGLKLYFAYTLYSPPWNYCDFVSNPVTITVVP